MQHAQNAQMKYNAAKEFSNAWTVTGLYHTLTRGLITIEKSQNKLQAHRTYVVLQFCRFRLCTLCSDSTGSIAVIFLDEEVSRIIDKTVFDLEAEAIQVNYLTQLICPKRLILLYY